MNCELTLNCVVIWGGRNSCVADSGTTNKLDQKGEMEEVNREKSTNKDRSSRESTPNRPPPPPPPPKPRPRPRLHQKDCPQRENPFLKDPPPPVPERRAAVAPLQRRREAFKKSPSPGPGWSFGGSTGTINVTRQASAPPEYRPQIRQRLGSNETNRGNNNNSNNSIRSTSSSVSNAFSDFGKEMQRKFMTRTRSADLTHFHASRSSFYVTIDDTAVVKEPPKPPTPTAKKSSVGFSVGIYLDELEITVATLPPADDNNYNPDLITRLPATIAFSEEEILIGKTVPGTPTFSVYELIREFPPKEHTFDWKTTSFTFSPVELLSIFFEKLMQEMQMKQKDVFEVPAIVLTAPFILTSIEKERLKQALKIAGISQVRLLSSALTSGISQAVVSDYYKSSNPPQKSKFILVVHSLPRSFSMAVVQISPHCITTKYCITSQNLEEGREEHFATGHGLMFSQEENVEVSPEYESSIWLAYKGGVDQLLKQIPEKFIRQIVGITRSWNAPKLNHILVRIFGDKEKIILESSEGPLRGACILAAEKILPRNILVHEASRTNLMLTSGPKKWRLECKNKKYIPGNLFTIDVPISPQGTSLVLQEEYSKGEFSYPVGQYRVVASMTPNVRNYDILVKCFISVDQDGVFTVGPHFSKEIAVKSFIRKDVLLPGDISLEIRRLMGCYENANYQRKGALNPSFVISEDNDDDPYLREVNNGRRRASSNEDVRRLTREAERLYIDTLRRLNPQGKNMTPEEIKAEHEKAKTETLKRFTLNMEANGLDPSTWIADVEAKLESVFQDIKEFLTNSKAKFKDWFNRKFPNSNGKSQSSPALAPDHEQQGASSNSSAPSAEEDDMMLFKTDLLTYSVLEDESDDDDDGFSDPESSKNNNNNYEANPLDLKKYKSTSDLLDKDF